MTDQRYTRQGKVCPDCERTHYTLVELDRGADQCRRCRGWFICRDCHERKPNSDYHRRGDGLRSTCKVCHIANTTARIQAAKLDHKVPTVEQHSDTSVELEHMMSTVQPTREEMRLIRKAVQRYGKKKPCVGEVLGMVRRGYGQDEYWEEPEPVRPGIWSIVNLMALEATESHLTEAA